MTSKMKICSLGFSSMLLLWFALGCSLATYTGQAIKEKFIKEEIVPELTQEKPSKQLTQECQYVKRGKYRVKECQ